MHLTEEQLEVQTRSQAVIRGLADGLLLMGIGVGVMLTASVNVVQSSFPERDQGEISGLSRSVSNLGSSLGTAIVGSVLVASSRPGNQPFAMALLAVAIAALVGLGAAMLLPQKPMVVGSQSPIARPTA